MGWTPEQVCRASVAEFQAAFRGAGKANGWKQPSDAPLLRDELAELMQAYPDVRSTD